MQAVRGDVLHTLLLHRVTAQMRYAQNIPQFGERSAYFETVACDLDLPHGLLKVRQAFFQHTDRLPHLTLSLEVAEKEDIIGHITDAKIGCAKLVGGDRLCFVDQQHGNAQALQVLAESMKMPHEVVSTHRETIARNAIDHDNGGFLRLYIAADFIGELVRSVAQRLYLTDSEGPVIDHRANGNIERFAAINQDLFPFLKDIDDRMFAPACHLFHELESQSRLAYTARTGNDGNGAAIKSPMQHFIQFWYPRGDPLVLKLKFDCR